MRLARALVAISALVVTRIPLSMAQHSADGFYAGIRFGGSSLDTPKERDRPGPGLLGYDRNSMTWSAFAGHLWRASPRVRIGAEIGYADNGRATITYASANEYSFRSTQLDILGSATIAVGRGFGAFAKGGVGRVKQVYRLSKYTSGTPDLNSQFTKDLPVAAVGIGRSLSSWAYCFAEVRRTFGDRTGKVTEALTNSNPTPPQYRDMLTSVARVDALSVGLGFFF